jgi:hypothetical protein
VSCNLTEGEAEKRQAMSCNLAVGARHFIEKNEEKDCWRFGILVIYEKDPHFLHCGVVSVLTFGLGLQLLFLENIHY